MATSRNSCLICCTLVATNVDDAIAEIGKAQSAGADAIEIVLDQLEKFDPAVDVAALLKDKPLPVVLTIQSAESAALVLEKAVEAGADFVDIPDQIAKEVLPKVSRKGTTKTIISFAYTENVPAVDELAAKLKELRSLGADVPKVVAKANNICDCHRIFQLLLQEKEPTIAFATELRGEISRLLAPKYGSFLTYATLAHAHSHGHGDGIPTMRELLHTYLFRRIGKESQVFGVMANPVGHSKSPILMNHGFEHNGIDAVYVPLLVDNVKEFFDTFDDYMGFSVTLPHKAAAIPCCKEVDPVAREIGAVNNLVRRPDGSLYARNTDWGAVTTAIEDGLREREGPDKDGKSPLDGRVVVLVGAGGAGRAVAFGTKREGAVLLIADLDESRAKELASIWGAETTTVAELQQPGAVEKRLGRKLEKQPVLAHATPVGMQPNVEKSLFTRDVLGGYAVVFDAVYTPPITQLLKEGQAAGAAIVSGAEMFIRQAAHQFENFIDRPDSAPRDKFRDLLFE